MVLSPNFNLSDDSSYVSLMLNSIAQPFNFRVLIILKHMSNLEVLWNLTKKPLARNNLEYFFNCHISFLTRYMDTKVAQKNSLIWRTRGIIIERTKRMADRIPIQRKGKLMHWFLHWYQVDADQYWGMTSLSSSPELSKSSTLRWLLIHFRIFKSTEKVQFNW